MHFLENPKNNEGTCHAFRKDQKIQMWAILIKIVGHFFELYGKLDFRKNLIDLLKDENLL